MANLSEHATLYLPDGETKPKAIVQIVHGMAEHQKRYIPLAKYFNQRGIAVITSDLRGHGENISREEELGYFGDHALTHLIADVHDITMFVKTDYPDVPYFLLGHSMGTLISTCYFKKYDNFLDGFFLSGMPGQTGATGIAKILIKVLTSMKGEYHRSDFINNLVNGSFEKAFSKEDSKFAWLSKDKDNVKKYKTDPKCGFVFTLNGFYTLMELMDGTYKEGSWIRKNLKCPVMLLSGADDPCMGNKENFMRSVELFKKQGYEDVTYVLYPGQRHEIFLDTEKENAMNDVIAAIEKIIG